MIKNNNLLSLIIISLIISIIFSGCLTTTVPVKEKETEEPTEKTTEVDEKTTEETEETKLKESKKIIFTSNRDGNHEIYIMNADGTEQKNLTNNPANDNFPVWSPDGKKILFTSLRDHRNCEMYIMNVDGTDQKMLTKGLDISFNWGPSYDWSPDGKKIVFTYWLGDHKGNEEIYVMNADGTEQKRLTNLQQTGHSYGSFPKFSPDGKKILYNFVMDGNEEIYVMNTDGTNQKNLKNNPAYDYHHEWSQDGKRIVFVRIIDYWDTNNRYQSNREIYIMNADGTDQRRLTDNPSDNIFPDLSPDGTKIVFESVTVYYEENEIITSDIFIINIDGSKLTNLTNTPKINESRPMWSPDGRKILFDCVTGGESSEIYIINVDGTNRINLTNNQGANWMGCWQP